MNVSLVETISDFGVSTTCKDNDYQKAEPVFYTDLDKGLNVIIIPDYLNIKFANHLYKTLLDVEYRTDEESMIKIMGSFHVIPRKQIAFGVKGTSYHFSGTSVEVDDWDSEHPNASNDSVAKMVRFIASMLTDKFGQNFNYALVNKYPNEKSKIGYHADDEKELGDKPMILGLSLGQERQIYFKHTDTGEVVKVNLPHNSLMVMNYPTNNFWKHSIPSSSAKMKPRVSLTFRGIDNGL